MVPLADGSEPDLPILRVWPFVMSCNLLEAMACGCAVVGSDTAPVRAVIRHGENGLLVDFFSPADLASAVAEQLRDRERATAFGQAARRTVAPTYDLDACVTPHLALIALVARASINPYAVASGVSLSRCPRSPAGRPSQSPRR